LFQVGAASIVGTDFSYVAQSERRSTFASIAIGVFTIDERIAIVINAVKTPLNTSRFSHGWGAAVVGIAAT
jgi:hypothetical protein